MMTIRAARRSTSAYLRRSVVWRPTGDALAEGYAVRLLSDLSAATSLAAAQPVEVELAAVGATVATTGVLR